MVPYLTLMTEAAPQREHSLRELFNALRYVIRYGIAWRGRPTTCRPGPQSTSNPNGGWRQVALRRSRRICGRCCAWLAAANPSPRLLSSTAVLCGPRRKAAPLPVTKALSASEAPRCTLTVDTLGHLLALHVTPADVGDRCAVKRLAADIQDATGDSVELAYVDQGYTGEVVAEAAQAEGIALHVVKLPEAKRGFAALGGGAVVRLGNMLPQIGQRLRTVCLNIRSFHVIAFVGYMFKQAAQLMQGS